MSHTPPHERTAPDLPPVAVAGSTVLDLFPTLLIPGGHTFRDMLVGGAVLELGPLASHSGGSAPNTGISLHRLGVPVRLMGRIGDDLLGREMIRIFEAEGIRCDWLSVAEGETSYTIVLAPPETDRIFLHYPGPNAAFSAADIDWDVVARAGILHLGYPPLMPRLYENGGGPLADLLRRAADLGVTTSLDMCMVPADSASAREDWPAILERVLPHTDILLPGVDEMLFLAQPDLFHTLSKRAASDPILTAVEPEHVAALGERLIGLGAGIVGLKASDRGMYLRTGGADRLRAFGRAAPSDMAVWADRELWEPGFEPRHFETATGAGDAAVAGFLTAFLRGCGPEESLRMACALGAQNLEAADATSSIRSWGETVALVEGSWARNRITVDAPGWHFSADSGQWIGPNDAS
jgi:sugar/nucleoside kinase (ribokinase family)